MPGGSREAYKFIEDIVKKAAAQVDDGPCVTYIGDGGAGEAQSTCTFDLVCCRLLGSSTAGCDMPQWQLSIDHHAAFQSLYAACRQCPDARCLACQLPQVLHGTQQDSCTTLPMFC